MISEVEKILVKLKVDVTAVVELYPALSKEKYWALVRPGTQNDVAIADFLTYPTEDDKVELPIFTSNGTSIFKRLQLESHAEPVLLEGLLLFKRLKDIIGGKTVVAINPGSECGIRLTKEMLLSVISIAGFGKPESF